MAQIDIGKLTFNHLGDYASGTAYVKNDVVYYNGSAYIAKQSTTGNVPTNATYWNLFVLKGTDTSVLTTQGDVLYHDGSSLARLGAGTSGYFLKTQGSGANPVWAEMSGGDVVLVSESASGNGANINFSDVFTSTYTYYKATLGLYQSSSGYGYPRFRFLSSGTTQLSATNYSTSTSEWGMAHGNASSNYSAYRHYHEDYGRLHSDQVGLSSSKISYYDFYFYEPTNASVSPVMKFTHTGYSDNTWIEPSTGGVIYNSGGSSYTGFRLMESNSATLYYTNFKLYGFK